ncbi:MAG: hypothetical protein J6Y17_01055 [Elusimicrobiaceae bacterium]|nr:hypothetical protein [Elusimicrobiaceae bacterium]
MHKRWLLLAVTGLLGSVVSAGTLAEGALAQKIQATSPAYLNHFRYMRYYLPTQHITEPLGLWERWFSFDSSGEQERALAFYLFNMYAISHSSQQSFSASLDLNKVGVLDGFMLTREPFDFKNASAFYQRHYPEVQAWLHQFFSGKKFPWPLPTQEDYLRWVSLLETLPQHRKQAVYTWPRPNKLQNSLPEQAARLFAAVVNKAEKNVQKRVVLYDRPDARLEDLDHNIGVHAAHRKRTYRWVKEECYFSSYITAKILTAQVISQPKIWKDTRIYLMTVYSKQGEFLKPANGSRFTLANGKTGAPWRYHTAVFVVLPYRNSYVPVVLDLLLNGNKAVSLEDWLARFDSQVVFQAVPFVREQVTEIALRVPDKITADTVWVDGKSYQPAEVMH